MRVELHFKSLCSVNMSRWHESIYKCLLHYLVREPSQCREHHIYFTTGFYTPYHVVKPPHSSQADHCTASSSIWLTCAGSVTAENSSVVEQWALGYLPRVHTGRVVGQIAAQICPYNLLWCRRYKKIVPTRRSDRPSGSCRSDCSADRSL